MILVKTDAGQQVMKDRSIRLTPRQRSALILFDGRRALAEVMTAGVGQEDVNQLLELGLLQSGAAGAPASPEPLPAAAVPVAATAPAVAPLLSPPSAQPAASARSPQERYQAAYPIATRLTAGLGLRGFRLNLAVEAATTYDQLAALMPKIRAAVGDDKAQPLETALQA